MKIFLGNNKINKLNYIRENATPGSEVDSQGNPLSPEQVKFFKNSKVRDRNGNLLVCYHGTPYVFDEFDKSKVGSRFKSLRGGEYKPMYTLGFYFTNDKYYASAVGQDGLSNNVKECYLNITNPLVVNVEDWGGAVRYADVCHSDLKRWSRGHDGIIINHKYDDDIDTVMIAFEPNQIKSITNTNPTNSNNINEELLSEGLHKLGTNCFITDSPYDIKNLIINKPKLYRILYDSNIDMYMIGDGNEIIHWDMLKESHRQGYYVNYEDYIDSLGSLYNYFDVGTGGDYNGEEDVDPFLWFIVFSPDEQSWVLGDDSYDAEYHSPYGNIFTRDCDLKDIELYKVLKVSNDVKNLYDNKELTEKMSTSIKSGDRVKMDFHMKSNNGATGTCKGRLGELCFIEWDDGSKSKEITSFLTKIEDIKESNELVQRAKKHKKKSRGMGWHMSMNAGNVEKGIEVFNNSTGNVGSGDTGMSMGESVEKKVYRYVGPVYYRGMLYRERVNLLTKATTRGRALANILYQAAGGTELQHFDIEDNLLEEPTETKETLTCDNCGHPLNDMGQCPACDQGEEELYDDLSSLEALWELSKLDNNV